MSLHWKAEMHRQGADPPAGPTYRVVLFVTTGGYEFGPSSLPSSIPYRQVEVWTDPEWHESAEAARYAAQDHVAERIREVLR